MRHFRWIIKPFRKTPPATLPRQVTPALSQLNLRQLPLLTARALVELIELDNVLRSIKRLVAVSETHWNQLYKPAIDLFIELCQLAPASMAHHHAGPGGLAAHTLESIEIALRLRKPLILPRNADPDTSARQEHVWTYAILVAVLLHDNGKLFTTTRLRLCDGQLWSPHAGSPLQTGLKYYSVEFLTAPYKLHARVANAGMRLLPQAGMAWLSQYPEILAQVCAYLYGDLFEAGVVGEIAQHADGESLARNLKRGGDRLRFPNAPAIPMVDRLIIGLRQMLLNNELKINTNGADGWSDGQHLWLVCGTVAKKLIEHLRSEGMTQVPTDNTRIFDTLQEHGFIVPTKDGKAIWHTRVIGPDNTYRFNLTMLKFDVGRLIPPTRRPTVFDGTLIPIDPSHKEKPMQQRPAAPPTVSGISASTPDPASEQEKAPSNLPLAVTEGNAETTTITTVSVHNDDSVNTSTNDVEEFFDTTPATTDTTDLPEWMVEDPISLASASTESHSTISIKIPNASTSAEPSTTLAFDDIRPQHLDDNVGQNFVDWLARMLRNNKLAINRRDAVVHIVPEGALIVSPRAFKEFVTFFDLTKRSDNMIMSNDDAAKLVQKRVEKLRQNIKTPTGMSVHTYIINGQNRTSRITGFLFDPVHLFGHVTPPPANALLCKQ